MLASFGGKPPEISSFDEIWYQDKSTKTEPDKKISLIEVLDIYSAHHMKLKSNKVS